ncbi:MAG: hypothetical protein P8J68_04095 [Arenicellaceae bacterium]|nr:hypothetical protein [Arenicellaceae bacterium]
MRTKNKLPIVLSLLVYSLLLASPGFGQSWVQYNNMDDFFSINIPPGIEPTVEEITWASEYDAVFPARVYTVEKGESVYSLTVIDYTDAYNIHKARTNTTEADAPVGYEYWRIDVIASVDYAATKYRNRGGKVNYDAWHHIDRIAGHQLNITNADNSSSYVGIYLHEARLYIIEARVPEGYPPQGHFQQGLGILDKEGVRIRYDWDENGDLVRRVNNRVD